MSELTGSGKDSTIGYSMELLARIREKIFRREYELSKHAVDQSVIRKISIHKLEEAISKRSAIIENYPDDKYGPSCLLLGFTYAGRTLHIQCSYTERILVKIITFYEPDPAVWQDLKVRIEH